MMSGCSATISSTISLARAGKSLCCTVAHNPATCAGMSATATVANDALISAPKYRLRVITFNVVPGPS